MAGRASKKLSRAEGIISLESPDADHSASVRVARDEPKLTFNSADPASIARLMEFARAKVPENARRDYVLAAARIRYYASVRATRLPEVDRWIGSRAQVSAKQ